MNRLHTLAAIVCLSVCLQAQAAAPFWIPIDENGIKPVGARDIVPKKYKTFHIVDDNLKRTLWSAPDEGRVKLKDSQVVVDLPMPNGTVQKFRVVYSPVMAPELAAKYPGIRTFSVMAVDGSGTYGKVDWTDAGLHAMIRKSGMDIYVDPFCRKNTTDYISYNRSDSGETPIKPGPGWHDG